MKLNINNKALSWIMKVRIDLFFLPFVIFLIVLLMVFIEPRFFSRLNISNVLRYFSALSFIALCQGLVMIVGGFDLSVGSIMAMASVVSATTMISIQSIVPGMVGLHILCGVGAGIIAGALAGLLNGTLVSQLKVSPFIITMGTMSIISGSVYLYTKGAPIYGLPKLLIVEIGRGRILNLPILFFVALLAVLILWFIMVKTPFGRHTYAVGSNPRAAYESGIKPTTIILTIYTLSGVLSAVAGLIITARIGSGQSGIGSNAAIESIAAAVIGGVSLRGGIGSIPKVALGALFLAIISNTLNLAHIDSKYQTMVLGFFLIFAIAIERWISALFVRALFGGKG
ncbi:ribose import permease protein RbsC [Desulfosarcina ovata subsp. sediminis]|uniref:Autoinducer 2 import system permease protein LsrD n=1 Tax=Desulfosarcina ovata subsp. sediminis TaxID=885957 RepID=A0A5K7ZF53_9BACT|nr:ABC transporter permease [Desulfosarcina ovata]BBO79904.1 ribose import permease protein RbsC [Desulfosarcina ovata subsp. sediminis]